jgi:hypothetical protein
MFPEILIKNIFTLTIYFIILNGAYEFVLIYRPHPVYKVKKNQKNIYSYFWMMS